MISIVISGATTASNITVSDSGHSGYILKEYNGGRVENQNTLAESRWVDGASLTSSKKALTTIDMIVQVWGSSLSDLETKIAALGANLDQWGYTVTVTPNGVTATTYTCIPANYAVANDPQTLRYSMAEVSVQIPRQP